MSRPASARAISKLVLWVMASLLGLLLLLVLVLAFMDWNALRGPISRAASRRLHRAVSIEGNLDVHVFSWTPSVDVQGLRIGNPSWVGKPYMAQFPRLHVAVELARLLTGRLVLADLELDHPTVTLLRDAHGQANWNFEESSTPQNESKPTRIPPLRRFELNGGNLDVEDEVRKLTFKGQVGAQEGGATRDSAPFSLRGEGTLNKEPFSLELSGDPLLQVRVDRAYHFQTHVQAGPSEVRVKGTIAKPFDLGDVSADITLRGQNLANLYYLTNLALPLTPPYELSVSIHRQESHFAIDRLDGRVGASDLHGSGSVDLAVRTSRPRLSAHLSSHALKLSDLGVALGARVDQPAETHGKQTPQEVHAPRTEPVSPLLLPTFEFQFDRLRSMDADVDFRADSVQTESVPIQNVSFHLVLNRGDLVVDPLEFVLPEGRLAGNVELDAQGGVPQARADLRLTDVHLDQFRSRKASPQDAPLDGTMQGRMRIEGTGNSVHAIASDANGSLSLVLPHGQMREAFAELAGIDIVRGLGLLLAKKDQTVPVRCGIIDFQLHDGTAQADHLLFDTENVLVVGDGHISLGDEAIDLNIKGEPKKLRFDRIRAPVNVRGTLRHPSISLSAPALAKQGAAAAVLGVVATPFAALLAFVDPGLAKNADCAGLTDEVAGRVAQPAPVPSSSQPDKSPSQEKQPHE